MSNTSNILSGGLNNYYLTEVKLPQRTNQLPYVAECEDIIQSLKLDFNEGNVLKALWRRANQRLHNGKEGNSSLYDAQKINHYASRILKYEELENTIRE